MAFSKSEFAPSSIGAGSGAPNLHSYTSSTDNKAAVVVADYFLDAYAQLKPNDAILIVASDGMIIVRVLLSTSATVTVELLETTTV